MVWEGSPKAQAKSGHHSSTGSQTVLKFQFFDRRFNKSFIRIMVDVEGVGVLAAEFPSLEILVIQ